MKGTAIDLIVQLLGSGSKQTLTVQSDLNKLPSQANQSHSQQRTSRTMFRTSPASSTRPGLAGTTTTSDQRGDDHDQGRCGDEFGSTMTTTTRPTSAQAGHRQVSVTTVGPTWGSSITNDAIKALIIFFIVVGIYISIRFEPKMALAAFIAMIHDVLVAVGIYSIFNFQVTPDTVVAILTILGYSLYDTVAETDRHARQHEVIGLPAFL